jgi:hypothetical protein
MQNQNTSHVLNFSCCTKDSTPVTMHIAELCPCRRRGHREGRKSGSMQQTRGENEGAYVLISTSTCKHDFFCLPYVLISISTCLTKLCIYYCFFKKKHQPAGILGGKSVGAPGYDKFLFIILN